MFYNVPDKENPKLPSCGVPLSFRKVLDLKSSLTLSRASLYPLTDSLLIAGAFSSVPVSGFSSGV